jgi:hypothetical protein
VAAGAVVDVGAWPTQLFGLVGPLLAAVVVSLAVHRWPAYRKGLTRWRIGRWWLVAVSPLAMLAVAVAVPAAAVVTTMVMVQAAVLVVADLVTRGRVLAPPR